MTYQTAQTIQYGNCTIVVHRPVLTKEEAAGREKQVLTVLEATMKTYIKRKEKAHV